MGIQNYTPLPPHKKSLSLPKFMRMGKEGEPKFSEPVKIGETLPTEPERPKEQSTHPSTPVAPKIEVIPEMPELDESLRNEGVEVADHNTIFVNSRKIELPLPLEKVDSGLHKPLTSGWRWVAEITKYILARFHIVIRKKNGKYKLIEQI